ncbi:Pc06g02180 [Penicillium rubens Wisconsin 54-1255]|uniref:Pc06g02180 protein n=1 Tax=Penicillium rubens (strain ATCC 28089 / DSM 1075 / NRRL 1951 / Wisconsin 54-1255) TaxID=500485 RepID=B6GWB9_PENRW|nr:Pc06g02180 [Penicillium rubens Wisconsin 54-1255]
MEKCDASSARIRENQRRSRTRRKEYTQQLEQQLRSYERLGVAATQEVQKAGRKVAAENVSLRSLLLIHGVTETQIEEYLESQRQTASSIRSQFPPVVSLPSAKSHLPTAHGQTSVDHHHSLATPLKVNNSSHPLKTLEIRSSPSRSDAMTSIDASNIQESSTERAVELVSDIGETVPESEHFGGVQDTGQFTSCVAAASLIESIRNHSDFRDVRSELGCDSEPNCMVKNMSIFDILDR